MRSRVGDLSFMGEGGTPALLSPKENGDKKKMKVLILFWIIL